MTELFEGAPKGAERGATVADKPQAVVVADPKKPATLMSVLSGPEFQASIAQVLPSHLTAERFVKIALGAFRKTPKLKECTQVSLIDCLMKCSELGLEPDGRLVHLIPYEDRRNNITECQLIIDYKGLVELALRSGDVVSIHADKVCQNDEFEYDRGQVVRHRIDFRQPRGDVFAYYCIIRLKDGSEKAEVMSLEEVQGIMARSKAKNYGPWVTDFHEMGKKSVFKRASKWLRMSPEFRMAYDRDFDSYEPIQQAPSKPRPLTRGFVPVVDENGEVAYDGETQG